MYKKSTEERDNEDYRLMTHWTQLKIGMSTLRRIRELQQRNVNQCKKVHELISRESTTTTQSEERDMTEWECNEAKALEEKMPQNRIIRLVANSELIFKYPLERSYTEELFL